MPPNATVVGVPGHIVAFADPGDDTVLRLPDPEWDVIQRLESRIAELESRLEQVEGTPSGKSRTKAKTDDAPSV